MAFDAAPGYTDRDFAGEPCPTLAEPLRDLAHEEELVDAALRALRASGVRYGDLRLGRDVERELNVHDENVSFHRLSTSSGIGVRAMVDGFWGFAATSDLDPAAAFRVRSEEHTSELQSH
mgnify:CR=1 FL=1